MLASFPNVIPQSKETIPASSLKRSGDVEKYSSGNKIISDARHELLRLCKMRDFVTFGIRDILITTDKFSIIAYSILAHHSFSAIAISGRSEAKIIFFAVTTLCVNFSGSIPREFPIKNIMPAKIIRLMGRRSKKRLQTFVWPNSTELPE